MCFCWASAPCFRFSLRCLVCTNAPVSFVICVYLLRQEYLWLGGLIHPSHMHSMQCFYRQLWFKESWHADIGGSWHFSGEFMSLLTTMLIWLLLAAARDGWRMKEFFFFFIMAFANRLNNKFNKDWSHDLQAANALNTLRDSITALDLVNTAPLLGSATLSLTGSDYLVWDCISRQKNCFYSLLNCRPIITSGVHSCCDYRWSRVFREERLAP